jgi:hypothetical protein
MFARSIATDWIDQPADVRRDEFNRTPRSIGPGRSTVASCGY